MKILKVLRWFQNLVENVLTKKLSTQQRKYYFVLYFALEISGRKYYFVLYFVQKFSVSNYFPAIFLHLFTDSEICIKLCVFLNTNEIICEFSFLLLTDADQTVAKQFFFNLHHKWTFPFFRVLTIKLKKSFYHAAHPQQVLTSSDAVIDC